MPIDTAAVTEDHYGEYFASALVFADGPEAEKLAAYAAAHGNQVPAVLQAKGQSFAFDLLAVSPRREPGTFSLYGTVKTSGVGLTDKVTLLVQGQTPEHWIATLLAGATATR